jgi:hypothetical protein
MIWGHTDLRSAHDYGARGKAMVEFQVPKDRFVKHAHLPPRDAFGYTPEEREAKFADHWGGSNHVAYRQSRKAPRFIYGDIRLRAFPKA